MDAQDHRRFDRQVSRPIGAPIGEHAVRLDLAGSAGRILSSDTLFQGSREIGIEHYGSLYRLKITRQGKLILNK